MNEKRRSGIQINWFVSCLLIKYTFLIYLPITELNLPYSQCVEYLNIPNLNYKYVDISNIPNRLISNYDSTSVWI